MPFKDTPDGTTHSFNDGCGEPAHNAVTTPALEEIIENFWDNFAHFDLEYNSDTRIISDWLRTVLTTTHQQAFGEGYEDGVKAERERVREWAQAQKEKLTMKWDTDKAKSTVYDAILYGWDGFLPDKQ